MAEQGSFIWYELSTDDVEGARTFYKDVVRWESEKFGGGEPPYWVLSANGAGIGGVMPFTPETKKAGASPHWVGYVISTDVDALIERVVALDATTCLPPHDIPTVGRIAMFADPQGAVLAAIKPQGPDRPHPTQPTEGHVVWRELLTNDVDAALGFYGELLGWEKTRSFDMGGAMGVYQMYGKGGVDYGGMMKRPAGYPLPPHFLFYVHVSDLDAALERVKKDGGKIWQGPMPIPDGARVAQCADPRGAVFALHGS